MAKKKKAKKSAPKRRPAAKKPARKASPGGIKPGSPKVGSRAPDFTLPTDGSEPITLSEQRGRNVVLYFYPRDDTPGCTKEACGFNDALPDFLEVNAEVIGVSKDSESSHEKFREKYKLRFRLAADTETKVAKAYGVWIKKSLYGHEYMGMDRATFLIDKTGTVRQVWRSVKVPGHVEEVLAATKAL
jgi:peroxiredoxin Q/BCP